MTAGEKALRFNTGKLRVGLIPWQFIEELTKVFTRGAVKYTAWNWTKSLNTDDHDAFVADRQESMLRHLLDVQKGELYDPEVVPGAEHLRVTHYGAIAWNALVCMWYETQRVS